MGIAHGLPSSEILASRGTAAAAVAVNVAAAQFRQGNLLEVIRSALEDAGLNRTISNSN